MDEDHPVVAGIRDGDGAISGNGHTPRRTEAPQTVPLGTQHGFRTVGSQHMNLVGGRIRHQHPTLGGMHRDPFGSREAGGQAGEVSRCDQSINAAGQTVGDDNAAIWMLGNGSWPIELVKDRGPLTNSERFDAQRRQQDQ